MIKWSDEFSVNNKEIDIEHQSLFNALNLFYEGLQNNAPTENMGKLIANLIKYAKSHFSSEEKHMKRIGFPGLEAHMAEHEAFISKAEDFMNKFNNGKMLLSVEVTNFIKEWITNHIKTQDKQYAAYEARQQNRP